MATRWRERAKWLLASLCSPKSALESYLFLQNLCVTLPLHVALSRPSSRITMVQTTGLTKEQDPHTRHPQTIPPHRPPFSLTPHAYIPCLSLSPTLSTALFSPSTEYLHEFAVATFFHRPHHVKSCLSRYTTRYGFIFLSCVTLRTLSFRGLDIKISFGRHSFIIHGSITRTTPSVLSNLQFTRESPRATVYLIQTAVPETSHPTSLQIQYNTSITRYQRSRSLVPPPPHSRLWS